MTASDCLVECISRATPRRAVSIVAVIFSLNWVGYAHAGPHDDCLRGLRARLATDSELSPTELDCLDPTMLSGTHSHQPWGMWRIYEPADASAKPAVPPSVQIHDEETTSALHLSSLAGPSPEYLAATAWMIQQVTFAAPEFELLKYLAIEFKGDSPMVGACSVFDYHNGVSVTIDLADASPGGNPSTCPNVQQLCIPGRTYLAAALLPGSVDGRLSVFSDLTVVYPSTDHAGLSPPVFFGGNQ